MTVPESETIFRGFGLSPLTASSVMALGAAAAAAGPPETSAPPPRPDPFFSSSSPDLFDGALGLETAHLAEGRAAGVAAGGHLGRLEG